MSKRKKIDYVDEELLCIQLVVNATQTPCCGALFCRVCIMTWTDINFSGPCCRRIVYSSELIIDVRSERKSRVHLRCCKYYDNGCEFVSGRTEMDAHEKICQVKPKSKNLRAENQALSLELIGAKQKITDLDSK